MQRHNVTIVDFKKKKKPVFKIILLSFVGIVILTITSIITVFILLPSLTSDEINKYIAPQGDNISYQEVIGEIPQESITWEQETQLANFLTQLRYRGVDLWEYNSLLRKWDQTMLLGSIFSNTTSPTLDNPDIWNRMDIIMYNEKIYLLKYFPSFYGPSNISCYEILEGRNYL